MGRDKVLAAAVELLEQADLADLLAFLGTRAVAEAADVQPATVHHHFHNRDDNPKPNARLAAAVLGACLRADEPHAETIRALEDVGESAVLDVEELSDLRSLIGAHLRAILDDRPLAVGVLVGALASRHDALARDTMREFYISLLDGYAPRTEANAAALGRRFDTAHGFSAEVLAIVGRALTDGLVLRQQFDPDRIDPALYGEIILRLLEVMTLPDEDELATDVVTERLLRRASALELPAASGLDQAKRAKIVTAIHELYDSRGVESLTITAVAREAGVSRGTVIANFGDRNGLAAVIWAGFLPDLERRVAADRERGMPLARLLERHLHRVVDLTKDDRQLTALLLDGIIGHTIRHGPPTYVDPTDPRTSVPLPALLVPVLQDAADQLRPGLADTPAGVKDLAASITNLTMVRTMSRPDETTSDTVQRIMDLFLDGILRPTP